MRPPDLDPGVVRRSDDDVLAGWDLAGTPSPARAPAVWGLAATAVAVVVVAAVVVRRRLTTGAVGT